MALEETGGFTVVDCLTCGGLLKPDVVFFGENVPKPGSKRASPGVLVAALVVLGSSLTVMSGLRYVRHASSLGIPVVIVNQGATRGDELAAATARRAARRHADRARAGARAGRLAAGWFTLAGLGSADGLGAGTRRAVYRADWTKLTLSGTVTGAEPVVDTVVTVRQPRAAERARCAACAASPQPGFRPPGA